MPPAPIAGTGGVLLYFREELNRLILGLNLFY